jgi:uncharacterized membrane protein
MENIVIATFDDTNAALRGLRELQQLDDAEKLKLRDAAVVERRADGTWRIADEATEAGRRESRRVLHRHKAKARQG